ncbi:bacterio-opsin activator domain-containing protein [Natronomonas marina]|jgi:PAS domain S-box-containing protein|uniref:bacterio-opsin activator domain-containing protein n=1 Tax=Natronomonas marina TaxID=2961939 RepID=UPI0020C9E28F|nr:bacterio-opsin activator domain-containing protein [Natronomonas marina]
MGDLKPDTLARGILGASPDLCYAVDREGRLLWWNETVAETTGYDESTLEGLEVFEVLPPDQREDARTAFEHAGSFPPDVTVTFDVLTADGECVPHEFNGAKLDIDGRTVIVGIGRDVSERRERERRLRRRRDELERLNRIGRTVHEVVQAVTDAATRAGVEEVTCERLADCELYQSVWIGRNDHADVVEPRAGVGTSEEFLDVVERLNGTDWNRPARVAVETETPQVVQGLSDLPTAAREAAERFGIASGIAVPVVHRDHVEGVLCIYSSRDDAFSERERKALGRLGSVVGFAIHATQTERLLLSESTTELRFRVTAPDGLLAPVSELADGACHHEWSTPTESGNYRHYVTVPGSDSEAVPDGLAERSTVESVSRVGSDGDDDVFEVITNESLVHRLLDAGAVTTDLVSEDGVSTVVAEVPGEVPVRPVVEAAEESDDAELVSKRTLDRTVRTAEEFHDPLARRLTDRQQAALRHAYFGGYFSWPREATAEELADAMDISSPTLHYHLRQAEEALVEAYLQQK